MSTCISAVQHLRPLRGGAQAHLLRASDGACYVIKFLNNPQHIRVLANEMFATKLGLALGLPMPRVEVIEVSDWLIEQTEDLRISLGGAKIPCRSGKQLGSLYVGGESPGMSFDYLPRELLQRVVNIGDFPRILVLDKWTCNSDGRQAIFCKAQRRQPCAATFIDQGYCFNAGEWTFPDSPLRAHTRTTAFTRVSWDGRRLSRRPVGPNRWMRTPFGGALPGFPKSGTKEIEMVWSGWYRDALPSTDCDSKIDR